MSVSRFFIATVVIALALGLVLACGPAEEPSEVESDKPMAKRHRVPPDVPGPIVDLDPDPGNPDLFAWYRTPPPGRPGFPDRIPMSHEGSIFATMDPDTGECAFREDFIGGKKIDRFTVWGKDHGQMKDARKVRLRSLTEQGEVKIEIVIEKVALENRLHWVVDDKTDQLPACTLSAVRVVEGEENLIPLEFEALERGSFREISAGEKVATDLKFWVYYKAPPPTE